jgi:hypothetical protein
MNLKRLIALGFDNSRVIPFTKRYRVSCSQCEALCINGVPTHEHGCPNAVHECRGCNELIPVRQIYCSNC